jgi:hypothetical protein
LYYVYYGECLLNFTALFGASGDFDVKITINDAQNKLVTFFKILLSLQKFIFDIINKYLIDYYSLKIN